MANLPETVRMLGGNLEIAISNNAGTLTLETNRFATASIFATLTLTIDGVTTEAFTLTISEGDNGLEHGGFDGTITAQQVVNADNSLTGAVRAQLDDVVIATGNFSNRGFTLTIPQPVSNEFLISIEGVFHCHDNRIKLS